MGEGEHAAELDEAGFDDTDRLFAELTQDEVDALNAEPDDEAFLAGYAALVPAVAQRMGDARARAWRERGDEELRRHCRTSAGFEGRLYELWGPAIAALEHFRIRAAQSGAAFHRRHVDAARRENDLVFEVLTRLHARALMVTSEMIALLRTGHPSGAYARWRTLHELAVVAFFVRDEGRGVADRYLLHEHITAWYGARAAGRVAATRFSR